MPCTTVAKTEPERRSFQFFRERTLSQLTASFAEELWDKTIFQVAETEPSIRHAMFALSGFHEHFLNPHKDNANMQLGFALTQYNLAIRELLCFDSDRGHTSIVLHLVSCLIFIAIESVRGQFDNAVRLYRHGRQVIRENRRDRPFDHESDRLFARIETVFIRLDVQIIPIIGRGKELWMTSGGFDLQPSLPSLPRELNSLVEAREALERFAYSYHHALTERLDDEEYLAQHDEYVEQWAAMLNELEQRQKDKPSEADKRGFAILHIHQKEAELVVATRKDPLPSRKRYEGLTSLFHEMLGYAETAIGYNQPKDQSIRGFERSPSFNLDIGVIPIVHFATVKCKDPSVQQRGLDILHKSNRQEGIWNAKLTAAVAERQIELEKLSDGDVTAITIDFNPGERSGSARFQIGEKSWQDDYAW